MATGTVEALRRHGLRATPQRVMLLEELRRRHDHPSAEDLHRSLLPRSPTLALSTVYATLESLERVGLVTRLSLGEGRDRYDAHAHPHAHLVCLGCGQVQDVPLPPLALDPAQVGSFRYAYSRVVHYGWCPRCQASAKDIGPRRGREECPP
jgi:Fur family peroxide stress response transcriptional regulator